MVLNPNDFGWASIQLDGGIDAVMRKIVSFFDERLRDDRPPETTFVGAEALRVGLLSQGAPTDFLASGLATLCKSIVAGGGTVVASDKDALLDGVFAAELGLEARPGATLGYGQRAKRAGFHIMANPRRHWGETLAGLGASGVEIMLGCVESHPLAGHPLVPALQVGVGGASPDDLDAVLRDGEDVAARLLDLLVAALSGEHIPRHQLVGNHDFQVTRARAWSLVLIFSRSRAASGRPSGSPLQTIVYTSRCRRETCLALHDCQPHPPARQS